MKITDDQDHRSSSHITITNHDHISQIKITDQDHRSRSQIKITDQHHRSGSQIRIKDQDQRSGSYIKIKDHDHRSRSQIEDHRLRSQVKVTYHKSQIKIAHQDHRWRSQIPASPWHTNDPPGYSPSRGNDNNTTHNTRILTTSPLPTHPSTPQTKRSVDRQHAAEPPSPSLRTHLTSERHGVVPAGSDADLPHERLTSPRKSQNQSRLQHILLIPVARVLVLPEGVDGTLPRQHAWVHRPRVDLLDFAVQPFHPGKSPRMGLIQIPIFMI